MNTLIKRALLLLLVVVLGISAARAIEDPRKKDPLIITGSLGLITASKSVSISV